MNIFSKIIFEITIFSLASLLIVSSSDYAFSQTMMNHSMMDHSRMNHGMTKKSKNKYGKKKGTKKFHHNSSGLMIGADLSAYKASTNSSDSTTSFASHGGGFSEIAQDHGGHHNSSGMKSSDPGSMFMGHIGYHANSQFGLHLMAMYMPGMGVMDPLAGGKYSLPVNRNVSNDFSLNATIPVSEHSGMMKKITTVSANVGPSYNYRKKFFVDIKSFGSMNFYSKALEDDSSANSISNGNGNSNEKDCHLTSFALADDHNGHEGMEGMDNNNENQNPSDGNMNNGSNNNSNNGNTNNGGQSTNSNGQNQNMNMDHSEHKMSMMDRETSRYGGGIKLAYNLTKNWQTEHSINLALAQSARGNKAFITDTTYLRVVRSFGNISGLGFICAEKIDQSSFSISTTPSFGLGVSYMAMP